jgi:adenine-specific DNA-methyltransferase
MIADAVMPLFDEVVLSAPETEGIKYAGSKQKLLPYILSLAKKVKPKVVLDGFAGSTRVSQAFAKTGHTVIANDISVWSETFLQCYLLNEHNPAHYQPMIKHLNHLPPLHGWFSEHYGGDSSTPNSVSSDGLKKPWQLHNTQRLDAIRNEIERMGVSQTERAVLLTSLIHALDEVDSTLGHFASYLNDWSPRSFKPLELQVPCLLEKKAAHQVHRKNIFELLPEIEVDLAYFDPPYGSNNEKMPPSRVRYSAYYHLWTTICLNDQPQTFGKAKRRADTSDTISASIFEEFRRNDQGKLIAVDAISQAIMEVKAKHILLSYSSGGRATAEELQEVIAKTGRLLEVMEIDHKRNVMAGMRWTNQWIRDAESPNLEFLFLVEKT